MENDEEDDVEVINPYEEGDPHNRPPPTSDKETEFAPPVVQIADVDDVPIPPVIQFGNNFHVGESSASRDLLESNSEVCAPGPMCCDLKSVHRGVKRLSKQMHDRYRTEKKMAKILRQDELYRIGQAFDLQLWTQQLEKIDPREEPYIHTAPVPRADDPYVMIIMENVSPPNDNPNAPEEEPIMDQAPDAHVGFAPQWIGEQNPNNNNGRLEENQKKKKRMRLWRMMRRMMLR
nr:hypothetical protein [Tanacetum cinerariifolium]